MKRCDNCNKGDARNSGHALLEFLSKQVLPIIVVRVIIDVPDSIALIHTLIGVGKGCGW